jgi:hypothetical protein
MILSRLEAQSTSLDKFPESVTPSLALLVQKQFEECGGEEGPSQPRFQEPLD